MGESGVSHTAFKRIKKFNDDKTEQVWELFRDEFARASVAEDGETSWRCAAGIMSVDDINKQRSERSWLASRSQLMDHEGRACRMKRSPRH